MRVKMLVSMTGLTIREPGQVIEVGEEEAARLIAAGFAVPADEEKEEAEKATIEAPEKAVALRKRSRTK